MNRHIFIALLVVWGALCIGANAQTPYDVFASETSRPMLGLDAINTTENPSQCNVINDSIWSTKSSADDISKWLSVDPLSDKYPSISPYAYCSWNPVKYVDPDGKVVVFAPGTTNEQKNLFNQAVDYLDSHGCGDRYGRLENSPYTYTIIIDDSGVSKFVGTDRNNPVIYWNPVKGVKTKNGTVMSPSTVLDHEMDHGCAFDNAKKKLDEGNVEAWNEFAETTKPGTSAAYGNKEEERVVTGSEQTTAQALGEVDPGKVTRTDHKGSYVRVDRPTSNKPIE